MKYYNKILKSTIIIATLVTMVYASDSPAGSGSAIGASLTAAPPIKLAPREACEALKTDATGRVTIKSWSSREPLPDPELNAVKQGIYRGIEAIVLGQSPYLILEDIDEGDCRERVITSVSLHPHFLLITGTIQDLERRMAALTGDSLTSEREHLDTERKKLVAVKDSAITLAIKFLSYLNAVKKQLDQISLAKREGDTVDLRESEQRLKTNTLNTLSLLHAIFDFKSDSGYIASYQRKSQREAVLGKKQINETFEFKTGKGVGDNLHDKAFSTFIQNLLDLENILIVSALERGAIALVKKETESA